MAKTTTRPKPATSKNTKAAGSAAPDGAAAIRMIPLDQLEPSPLNVRKVAASTSDDTELLASIRETGIKQNLVVHALSETRFAVDAGGRRLKALKQLAEDGVIPADHPVPCLVEDERNAILTSATENLQRAAMHPADQFEAFDKMTAEGRSEDEIALKFGVSVDLVRRRLKLARVAPEIIEQFRAGDLTLECIMAFTLTNDHDRQGLVRPEDIPAAPEPDETTGYADGAPSPARPQVSPPTSSTPVPSSDPTATLRKADGISASLADDLRATRQHILRAHLAADFEVAFDAMLYALCEQALGRSYNNEALDISIRPFQAQNRELLHADTVAQKMVEALEQDLATGWMTLEKPEDFRAMSALPIADKQALFAWATGLAVKPQLSSDNRPSPIIEEIGARLDVDVAACWRPTAQNYWGRVNKGHAVATARKMVGDDYAEDRNRERKGDLAAAMERAFAETSGETEGFDAATAAKTTRWLPDGMVFAGAMEAVGDMRNDAPEAEEGDVPAADALAEAESDEPSSLPAFLSEDAA